MTGYSNLSNYYSLHFALAQHHGYTFADINGWLPFERDIYINLLMAHIKKQNEK